MPTLKVVLPTGNEMLVDLTEPVITIGRVEDNMLQIEDGSVSSHHAELSLLDTDFLLKDLGSTNGTYVNGQQIEEAALKPGDRVRFGSIESVYLSEAGEAASAGASSSDGQEELPEMEQPEIKPAEVSARPVDFTNASPFQKKTKKANPLSMSAVALAIVAILVAGGTAAKILLTMASPLQ